MRPRCCFLYLTFLGINMALFFLIVGRRFGCGAASFWRRRRGWLGCGRHGHALVFQLLLPGGLGRRERRDNRSRFSRSKIRRRLRGGGRRFHLSNGRRSRRTAFPPIPERWPARLRIISERIAPGLSLNNLALISPAFDADHT